MADHFPEAIEYDQPDADELPQPGDRLDPEEMADLQRELENIKLRLKPGASMPDAEQIRGTLGIPPEEPVSASNPEQLVPLARRYLARQRQQQLATMVMLGMQRIVIDSGKINASMRFHIDTRSAASEDKGSEFGIKNRVKASGSFGAVSYTHLRPLPAAHCAAFHPERPDMSAIFPSRSCLLYPSRCV